MTQTPPPDQGWSDRPSTDPAAPAPPPQSTWAAPGSTTTAVVTARPGIVTWGSITLIVLGALTLLIGLLFLLGGAVLSGAAGGLEEAGAPPGFEGMAGAFGGAIIVLALIVLAWGGAEIWVAIKAMAGRSWARIAGMVLAALGGLFALLGLVGAASGGDQGGGAGSLLLNLVLAAAYGFVIWAYATNAAWFKARSA